jgi:putative intracellular protease/amidase
MMLFGGRAEELVAPYYIFKEAGAHVDVVSIKGGKIPIGRLRLLLASFQTFWYILA